MPFKLATKPIPQASCSNSFLYKPTSFGFLIGNYKYSNKNNNKSKTAKTAEMYISGR